MITEHYYTKINNKMKSHTLDKTMSKTKEKSVSKDAFISAIIAISGLTLIAIIGILIHH
jgi:hypothetical protein